MAGHELKSATRYVEWKGEGICTPLMCLVDYLGYEGSGSIVHTNTQDMSHSIHDTRHVTQHNANNKAVHSAQHTIARNTLHCTQTLITAHPRPLTHA